MAEGRSLYRETHARSLADPEGFWGEVAREIEWTRPPQKVFDPEAGIYGRWFVGGECNACDNGVDRHVRSGRGQQAAILYDSPVTGTKRVLTYAALQDRVNRICNVLVPRP